MPSRKKRRMPALPDRWVTIEPPSDEDKQEAEEQGLAPPLDFGGWRIKVRGNVPAGSITGAMKLSARIKVLTDIEERSDEETVELMENAGWHFGFLASVATDWDFVDEEGEDIAYAPEAWRELPGPLVDASLKTVIEAVFSAPKAN